MRMSGEWMTQVDERILEYLSSEPWATPEEMSRHRAIRVPVGTVRERCRFLVDVELAAYLVGPEAEMVEITTWGLGYLRGEIDAAHRTPSRRALRGYTDGQLRT
jgi:hypothetical protein